MLGFNLPVLGCMIDIGSVVLSIGGASMITIGLPTSKVCLIFIHQALFPLHLYVPPISLTSGQNWTMFEYV